MHNPLPGQASRPSLRNRLLTSIWTIPAVVLPLLGTSLAWFAYDEYEQTIEQEYRFLEAHARIAESQLSGLLRNIKQMLGHIAVERRALSPSQLAAYQNDLTTRKQEFPEVRTLAVLDATGHVELTANPSLVRFDGSQREYFTVHRDRILERNFHISRPFKSSFGDYSVTFSVALRDDAQKLLGVVVAGVRHPFFDGIMKPILPAGDGSIAAIFNGEGDLIYRLPAPEKHVGASIAAGEVFQAFKRSGQPMVRAIGVARIDGVERIYVNRAIGNTGLGVSVGRPLADVLADWRRNMVLRLATFALAAAVTLRLAWVAHRRQEEVLAGKEFSEQLIATANVMVVGLDDAGRVIIFNEAAQQVTGYGRDELIGHDWFELLMPRERYPQMYEVFRTIQRTGDPPRTCEHPIITKDGGKRLVAWQNSAMLKDGKLAATISFGIDVTARKEIEQARYQEELSRRLIAIQEEERRRLAVELHDRTNPNLTALGINFKMLVGALPQRAGRETNRLLEDTATLLDDTIASIRAVSIDFRPPLLDYAGLWPALVGYARQFSRHSGIAVHAGPDELRLPLAPDVETHLFRIVQEALANCAKHSGAKTVRIEQTRRGDVVEVAITDDGVGFDPQADASGQGLNTMRQRAEFIGGKFAVDSAPGRGTRIVVEFASGATFAGRA